MAFYLIHFRRFDYCQKPNYYKNYVTHDREHVISNIRLSSALPASHQIQEAEFFRWYKQFGDFISLS